MHTAVYAIKQTHYCGIDFRTQNETYSTGNLISSLRQRSLMTREKGEERKRPLPARDAIVNCNLFTHEIIMSSYELI